MRQFLTRTLVAGTTGAVSSAVALAAAATLEGRRPAQPINATSHWLRGRSAGSRRRIDTKHTGVGFGTHLAATIFWAAFLESWDVLRPARSRPVLAGRACVVAAFAAGIDYTVTPRRFTPGWELVLSKRAMAFGYAAMAAGFILADGTRFGSQRDGVRQ